MNATILRPAPFMELLLAPRFGLAQGELRFFAAPDRPMRFIAVEDLGQIAELVFADPAATSAPVPSIVDMSVKFDNTDHLDGRCPNDHATRTLGQPTMIDLHYWTTPNGHKITIALEELGTLYRIVPVHISAGEQFAASFLRISPNNRIPAIVDHTPEDGGEPLAVFESGAILEYLAEKTGKLLPRERRERFEVLQWLYWQMAGLGPMAGQNHHFAHYAPELIPYAMERYVNETNRLYGVLDRRLRDRPFVAGEYSIADIACYPWVRLHNRQGQNLAEFPAVARWLAALSERPAVRRAYEIADGINTQPTVTEEAKAHLFGQTAKTIVGGS